MEPGNRLCSDCGRKTAEFFCPCTQPETFLCEEHLSKHTRKVSKKGHQSWPIALLPNYKNPAFLDRLEAFQGVSDEALRSVGQVDRAISELTAKVEEIKAALTVLCTEKVRELQETKVSLTREIPLALEEVERTLAEEQPRLNTLYGPLFRQHTENASPLQLFSFTIEACSLETLLKVRSEFPSLQAMLTTAPRPPRPTRAMQPEAGNAMELVEVTNTFLSFFNFNSSTWSPRIRLRTQIQTNGDSSWVIMEDGRVFCCGGGKAAYVITRDGSVDQKANMSEGRWGHGLLATNNPYVFGGYNPSLPQETCEKLELSNNKWTTLPSMREARAYFNLCMLLGIVYLCGDKSAIMEAFVPRTDSFLYLHITLPETKPCCLYVHNHQLVLHSKTYILTFAVGPDGQLAKRSEVRSPAINKFQNSQPVVDKANEVFFIIQKGECLCFMMETGVQGPIVACE